VLVESARIARGNIKPLSQLSAGQFDAVIFPGGFGAAKNLYVERLLSSSLINDVYILVCFVYKIHVVKYFC